MLFVVIGHGMSHCMILTPFLPFLFPCSRLGWGWGSAMIPRRGSSVEAFTCSASEPLLTTVICPGCSLKGPITFFWLIHNQISVKGPDFKITTPKYISARQPPHLSIYSVSEQNSLRPPCATLTSRYICILKICLKANIRCFRMMLWITCMLCTTNDMWQQHKIKT